MEGYRSDVKKMRSNQGRKDIVVISEQQVDDLCAAAPEGLDRAIRFSAYTGIRLGEMMALEDVDGELPGRLDIAYQRGRNGKLKKPKGGHERTIIVPWQAMAKRQTGYGSISGQLCDLSRTEHHRQWDATRRACGLELDWHELRHFAATWWLRQGATPEDVAIQLGHRDGGQLVRELYGHIEEDALHRLEALARSAT